VSAVPQFKTIKEFIEVHSVKAGSVTFFWQSWYSENQICS